MPNFMPFPVDALDTILGAIFGAILTGIFAGWLAKRERAFRHEQAVGDRYRESLAKILEAAGDIVRNGMSAFDPGGSRAVEIDNVVDDSLFEVRHVFADGEFAIARGNLLGRVNVVGNQELRKAAHDLFEARNAIWRFVAEVVMGGERGQDREIPLVESLERAYEIVVQRCEELINESNREVKT